VLFAVEELPDGRTGNIQMPVIENFKKETLSTNIKEMVASGTMPKTDEFKSYLQMKSE
jgi:hypothetical protein